MYGRLSSYFVAAGAAAIATTAFVSSAVSQPRPAGQLPDILGIRTGMPVTEAMNLLKTNYPGVQFETARPSAIDGVPTSVVAKLLDAEADTVMLDSNPRPPHVVHIVKRAFGKPPLFFFRTSDGKSLPVPTIFTEFINKYGPPSTPDTYEWNFDDQGRSLAGKNCKGIRNGELGCTGASSSFQQEQAAGCPCEGITIRLIESVFIMHNQVLDQQARIDDGNITKERAQKQQDEARKKALQQNKIGL
jgi:hypothetical protein